MLDLDNVLGAGTFTVVGGVHKIDEHGRNPCDDAAVSEPVSIICLRRALQFVPLIILSCGEIKVGK